MNQTNPAVKEAETLSWSPAKLAETRDFGRFGEVGFEGKSTPL